MDHELPLPAAPANAVRTEHAFSDRIVDIVTQVHDGPIGTLLSLTQDFADLVD